MSGRHLLLDGDVFAYQACAANEVAIEWEPGYWTWDANEWATRTTVERMIDEYLEAYDADSYTIALTDSGRGFRYDILPTYKGNRKSVKKPLVLKPIREWLIEECGAFLRPGLEGDDILGILATWPKWAKGKDKIVVSIDKDLKTIPGWYVRDLESGIMEITEAEADRWHMTQTLSGDPTDGYQGCPGIGVDRAAKAVEAMTKLVPYDYEITRGKRKGEVETRYDEVPAETLWEVVLSRFHAAGLSEEVALTQARVARILRYEDYDMKNKRPILWTPTTTAR